ncbi:MAG: bifunctional UDP-N-acetylglucosamine diphosphorylase/glucosamine-1-phosphate N-acetyltransferase GlmU [Mariprofundaceae bacterium]|nr:bifunctional UDP-N-acetylglucosamine diphosphorylase/glucosamine-1-phosphate N-acetyltransferase GlmU [Mariprofundaceae bacterium]
MPYHFSSLQVIVLAAGKGTRMASNLPKVLHPVLGKSMLQHVLSSIESLLPKSITLVAGHGIDKLRSFIGQPENLTWVEQKEQLGTAHAVLQAESSDPDAELVLIVCADTPLLQTSTLADLIQQHLQQQADVSILSAQPSNPYGYGRIVRDAQGQVTAIIEEKDANAQQRQIQEVSSGIFCVNRAFLFQALQNIGNDNAQHEYYLPDIVPIALHAGKKVQAISMDNSDEMLGINDRIQLAQAEHLMQQDVIREWRKQGVTIEQADTVRIEASVHIGADSVIKAGTQLLGSTHLGDDCVVGPYAVLQDSWLEDGITVAPFSHLERCNIGDDANIGPFARLRPGAKLDEAVKIGNFVEVKQAVIGRGSKVNHLSYIGDTVMGEDCNIGAGTITCNYDGANKHQTNIGHRVFVGSDTKLVAPVAVGSGATIGAGSIITKDVKEDGLTLSARPEQRHVKNWIRPKKGDR